MNSKTNSERQRGFSLIEILIAVGLIGVITALVLPPFESMIAFGQKEQTHAGLEAAASALKQVYQTDAMNIDSQAGDKLCLDSSCAEAITSATSGATPPSATPTATAAGTATANALQAIALQDGVTTASISVDGYHKHYVYYVSDRLSAKLDGTNSYTVYYHDIAIVSSEGNSALDPATTFNPATGQLTVAADNEGIVVSGLPIETTLMNTTLSTLQNVAQTYGSFFTSRYLSSSSRNPAVDYFSTDDPNDPINSVLFDSGSPIGNSGNGQGGWSYSGDSYPGDPSSPLTVPSVALNDCQPATVLKGFQATLGYSTNQLESAWGEPVAVCNGPNADKQGTNDRNPSNNSTAMETPPYTAEIAAWAPGEVALSVAVTGQD